MFAGIILAGGVGSRFGGDTPKQFLKLEKRPLIVYSLKIFERFFRHIVVVIHPAWKDKVSGMLPENVIITEGADTRQKSVFQGLKALDKLKPQFVAVHDSARPLVSETLMQGLIRHSEKHGSAVPVIPVSDTLVQSKNNKDIVDYPERSHFYRIQTPQIFHYNELLEAHVKAMEQNIFDFKDDSSLMFHYGKAVSICEGNKKNIKITSPEDLELVRFYLELTQHIVK